MRMSEGRGDSRCKGPEVGSGSACWRNSQKASVAEGVTRGDVGGGEGREMTRQVVRGLLG